MNIWTWNNETKEMALEAEVKIGQDVRVNYTHAFEVDGKTQFGKGRIEKAAEKVNLEKLAVGLQGQKGQVIGKKEIGDGGSRGARRKNEMVVVSFDRHEWDPATQKNVRVVEQVDPRSLVVEEAFEQAQAYEDQLRHKQAQGQVKRFLGKGQKFDEMTSDELFSLHQEMSRALLVIQQRKVQLDLEQAQAEQAEPVEAEAVAV